MNEKKKMMLADGALLLAALCWGGGFVAGDIAAENFSPFFIMSIRFMGAALWMGLLFRKHIRNSGRADFRAGAILGLILFCSQPIQIIALKYTTPSKQAFLIASYTVIVPFLSWAVLRRRPEKKAFAAGLLALCGIGLISLSGAAGIELGDILSLVFAFCYSFLIIVTGVLARKVNPLSMSFYQYLTTGVLSVLATLLVEDVPEAFPPLAMGALGYLMTINTVVAYTLQNVAQRYTTDAHAAVLISTESVIGYFCGVVLYGDPFTPRVLIGGLIVFSAVLLSVLNWDGILHKKQNTV